MRLAAVAQTTLLQELRKLQGGVTDTSTLIYLERLELLSLAAQKFSLLLIPPVIVEYGSLPVGAVPTAAFGAGSTDRQICQTAQVLDQPVFSEDRQVLCHAHHLRLPHYNTLLLILALGIQNQCAWADCVTLIDRLRTFARYSPGVLAVGDQLLNTLQGGANR